MSELPIPLRILSGLCLVPALWGITIYLFGGVLPFGTSQNAMARFGLYLAAQLLWLIPVAMFFVSINEYRRGYNLRAYLFALIGVGVGVISFLQMII
mgnify:CR=1 FL=1